LIKLTGDVLRSMIDDNLLTDDDINQMLNDYEKARKWDILENAKTHEALVDYPQLLKLRELIEKYGQEMGEHSGDYDYGTKAVADDIQKLLEESKN